MYIARRAAFPGQAPLLPVILLRLDAPAWVGGPPSQPRALATVVSEWTAADVMSFLAQKDLDGPARVLHANGVNGADFLDMPEQTLVEDFRLSRFAARKVLRARDACLQGL